MTENTCAQYVRWTYPGHLTAFISELFSQVEKAKDDEQRKKLIADWMRANANSRAKITALRIVFECFFLPSCKIDLPAGAPKNLGPMHKLPDQVSGSIFKAVGNIGYFLPASPGFIKDPLKRERAFIQFVESMNEAEGRLFIAVKDADPSFVPGLTHELVHSVVPGWIPAPAKKAEPKKAEVIDDPKKAQPEVKARKKPGPPKGYNPKVNQMRQAKKAATAQPPVSG